MFALQPWQGTVAEEAARTVIHVGGPGGVPERDVLVEARGAIEHCGKGNERTEHISYSLHHVAAAEKLRDPLRAAAVAWHCGGGGGTHR